MTDQKVQEITERIKQIIKSDDRENGRLSRKLCTEQSILCHALAIEYGRRKGWRYVYQFPVYGFDVPLLTDQEYPGRHNCIYGGSNFNVKALAENKRWAHSSNNDTMPSTYIMDHPYFFRDGRGRAVAVVAHPYGVKHETKDYCRENGLKFQEMENSFPSWWYPGSTVTVEFTADGSGVWPPAVKRGLVDYGW